MRQPSRRRKGRNESLPNITRCNYNILAISNILVVSIIILYRFYFTWGRSKSHLGKDHAIPAAESDVGVSTGQLRATEESTTTSACVVPAPPSDEVVVEDCKAVEKTEGGVPMEKEKSKSKR
jgi:hypothetical protein